MFDALSDQFNGIFDCIRGKGIIRDSDLAKTLGEIRHALLEADVALPVVKDFIAGVKEASSGEEIVRSVSAGQMIIKIVHDRLVALLGGEDDASTLQLGVSPPAVVMLVGLQGTGKTTTTAKLAVHLRDKLKKKALLVSLDTTRPAAQEQLQVLAEQAGLPALPIVSGQQPQDIAKRALQAAQLASHEVILLDTAGRLQIDEMLMREVVEIKRLTNPCETLLVADALGGQDTLNVAQKFHEVLGISGVVLSRMDGDSRGGVALSLRAATGRPIKFLGVGETINDLEPFHPDRLARRILGMGDVVSLVERAREQVSEEEAENMAQHLQKGLFDLNDLAKQLQQVRKMGGISSIMGMLPGIGKMQKQLASAGMNDRMLGRQTAIISSMTKQERTKPAIIYASRKKRIAAGSGSSVQEVNKLLKQFLSMQKIMKKMRSKGLNSGGMPAIDPSRIPEELRNMLPPR
ncbi:MAG: signal recognition particle protein [Alphaproteobacteria bacterium]|nr:signal recognition particle protein [Alphaproteobacteria bacterium]